MTAATTAHRAPATVSTWPLLGCLPELIGRRRSFWDDARRDHGDLYRLDLGVTEVMALCHPRHAQHVLVGNAANYADKGGATGFRATLLPLTGQGLSTIDVEDAHWRGRRELIGPAFKRAALTAMTDEMARIVDESTAAWPTAPPGTPVTRDVVPQVTRAVSAALARLLYGSAMTDGETRRVARAFDQIMNYMWLGMLASAVPPWLPFPGRARQRRAIATIERTVLDVVARRRPGGADRADAAGLVDIMAVAEQRLAAAGVRDEAVSLLLGAEPLAISVSWALHLLAAAPDAQRAAHAEVDRVLAGRRPGHADLPQLPYVRGVLKEALRLCPPTYWVQRRAARDDVIDGVRVPAGTVVVVLIHQIHRHPDIWQDPARFDPSRFTPERVAARHRQAWIPFGSGRRGCVAKEFSLTLGQLILTQALQRYAFTPTPRPRHAPELTVAANLRPRHGVRLRLHRRPAP